ncbi:MAG: hypothetical protein PHY72_00945 [Candidatus Pacebacteria bacterium]|nr:hypothetical protein [Candidatus Paceibacterota bacterium]
MNRYFYGFYYKATGFITNGNIFPVNIKQERLLGIKQINKIPIRIIELNPGEKKYLDFTGGDIFIIRDTEGVEKAVLQANVLFSGKDGLPEVFLGPAP